MSDVTHFFNEHWTLYQKLLEHNHLGHREFFGALAERCSQDTRLLDLGCGDATLASHLRFAAYEGVDQSEAALEIARERMRGRPARFRCLGLVERVEDPLEGIDMAIASYSVHHLPAEDKRRLLRGAARLPCLAMVDILRHEGETREQYLERFLPYARERWTGLTPREQDLVEEHMANRDFPESLGFWRTEAERAGFSRVEVACDDPARSAALLLFWR